MAARYWRLVGVDTYGLASLRLRALHLYSGGTRVDGTAALAATIAPTAGALENLQADDLSAVVEWLRDNFGAPGFALVWDFGAPATVTAVRFGAADLAAFPFAATLQSSTDGASWATYATARGIQWPGAGLLSGLPTGMGGGVDSMDALYMRFEGADGTTTFIDDAGHSFTGAGGAQLAAAGAIEGGTSLSLNGTGYIESPANSDFNLGTGAFTLRLKVRPSGFAESTLIGRASGASFVEREWALLIAAADRLFFYHGVRGSSQSITYFTLPFSMSVGNVYSIVFGRDAAGYRRCFVNGLECAVSYAGAAAVDNTDLSNPTGNMPVVIGAFLAGALYAPYVGLIDSLRLRKGEAPPVSADDFREIAPTGANRVNTQGGAARMARDVEVGGPGTIYGTTKTKGTPNAPTKARVVLLHQRSKLPVRETWSDPTTGYFEFRGIDTNQQFLTLAEDAEGHFRPVAASRLTPEVA